MNANLCNGVPDQKLGHPRMIVMGDIFGYLSLHCQDNCSPWAHYDSHICRLSWGFFSSFQKIFRARENQCPFPSSDFFHFSSRWKKYDSGRFFSEGMEKPHKNGKGIRYRMKESLFNMKKFHFLVATVDLHINAMSSMYFLLLGAGKIIMWTKQLSFLICEKKSVPSFVWSNAYGNKNWSLTQWICIILD